MATVMTAAQRCKTCQIDKPLEAFHRQKSKRSGRFSECKSCQRSRNQKWIDDNRDRFRHINRNATNAKRRRDPVRHILSLARSRCKKSGIEFSLSEEDISIPEHCPVLGIKLTFGLGKGEGHGLSVRDTRASLDRIDNSKGYVPENVIVVSYRANRLKSDANVSELLKIARFYAELAANKRGENDLPRVQSSAEKEERQMPAHLAEK